MSKSQTSILLTIGFIGVVIIFYLLTFFSESGFKKNIIEENYLSVLKRAMDKIKGFSLSSLYVSSEIASTEVASQGGYYSDSGFPRSWICNRLLVPSVGYVNYFLSNRTLYYLNMYISNLMNDFDDGNYITVNITNFTCVYNNVNGVDMNSGIYDEEYNVSAFGSKINVSHSNSFLFSDNRESVLVSQNRFWFLYRSLKDWVSSSGYKLFYDSVCDCLPKICSSSTPSYSEYCDVVNNPFCDCVRSKLKNIESNLNSYFRDLDGGNDYVVCKIHLIGCYNEKESCPTNANPRCSYWSGRKCSSCFIEMPGESCIDKINPSAFSITKYQLADDSETKYCYYFEQVKGSMEATVTCEDRKYYLSSPERELTFSFHVMIGLQKADCWNQFECSKVCNSGDCRWVPDPACCTGCS